jgi:SAM-dependent methyltransferase
VAELETGDRSPAAEVACCQPDEKAACCGESHAAGCGCAAGMTTTATTTDQVRETVRERYAAAAKAGRASGCCSPAEGASGFGSALYADSGETDAPQAAVSASPGCWVPTAVAELHEGEIVLDLGSGAGADVFISARRVGPTCKAIGIDMTDEMLDLARRNAVYAGVENRVHAHAGAAIIRARKPNRL